MEIETDRRVIKNRISLLKEELKKIDKQRQTQRKGRDQMVRVALVGYTNVGKSTIMNLFSKAGVKEENKLFATVDSTVRKVVVNNLPFLLSDTVGFIRKLPHHLIESFKSTLDEVREADILIHVVDMAHPFHDNQIEVVSKTLSEIGVNGIPTILVLNKLDLVDIDNDSMNLMERERYYHDHGFEHVVFLSAKSKTNLEEFRKKLIELVEARFMKIYPNYVPTYSV
jgi:GTP-binding protein HflX